MYVKSGLVDAGEMAQELRVLADFSEDWGLISCAHMVAHNHP